MEEEVVYERDSDIVPGINPDFDPKGTHALMDLDVSDFLVKLLKDKYVIQKNGKDVSRKVKNQIRKLKRLKPV